VIIYKEYIFVNCKLYISFQKMYFRIYATLLFSCSLLNLPLFLVP